MHPVAASAAPLVYVVTINGKFGIVDLATGVFHQIGRNTPELQAYLVWWNGSLLSLTISGNDAGSLARINPSSGEVTIIGPTGLGLNAFAFGEVDGRLYVTDFSNNIYSVNPETGTATLLRATGIPADPTIPFTPNANGWINLCDESLYSIDGKLYATFDSFAIDPKPRDRTYLTTTINVAPKLYQIDPSTGLTISAVSTDLNLGASVEAGGKFYVFKWVTTTWNRFGPHLRTQLLTLDLATGKTAPVENAAGPVYVDAAAGGIAGATPVLP
jgi:outer membrane protein assembly factor BamB